MVPFITKNNAITGGEKINIQDGFNGYLCDDDVESLEEYIIVICNDINKARVLGKNTYYYYSKYCTDVNMVECFKYAIEYNGKVK